MFNRKSIINSKLEKTLKALEMPITQAHINGKPLDQYIIEDGYLPQVKVVNISVASAFDLNLAMSDYITAYGTLAHQDRWQNIRFQDTPQVWDHYLALGRALEDGLACKIKFSSVIEANRKIKRRAKAFNTIVPLEGSRFTTARDISQAAASIWDISSRLSFESYPRGSVEAHDDLRESVLRTKTALRQFHKIYSTAYYSSHGLL
jgi:hypothetical protein